jgi:hypothetical protein
MAIVATQTSVGTSSSTLLVTGSFSLATTCLVTSAGAAGLSVGGTPITVTTGYPIPAGRSLRVVVEPGETLYASPAAQPQTRACS